MESVVIIRVMELALSGTLEFLKKVKDSFRLSTINSGILRQTEGLYSLILKIYFLIPFNHKEDYMINQDQNLIIMAAEL